MFFPFIYPQQQQNDRQLLLRARLIYVFLRGPEERTKETLVLCLCSGADSGWNVTGVSTSEKLRCGFFLYNSFTGL